MKVHFHWHSQFRTKLFLEFSTVFKKITFFTLFLGFLGSSDDKESTCNAGDVNSIPDFCFVLFFINTDADSCH